MSLLAAFKWSYAADLASKTVQPLVFLILARLLTPEDFGVVAAATMVISFSQVFWEAGMGKALIQRRHDVEIAADIAFWINMGLGVIVAAALFLSARPLADLVFHDLRVADVLRVMTALVFLGALGSVQTALLQKAMEFRTLFWLRLATVAIPGLASIPLALNGYGYWALVSGTIIGQTIQVAILWRIADFRPRLRFSHAVAVPLIRFGMWVAVTGLLGWFYVWADSLIVGMYLGPHELGLFRTGSLFVTMIFGTLFASLLPPLYSHIVRMQREREWLTRAPTVIVSLIVITSIPIAFLMFHLSAFFQEFFFGSQWQGISTIIGVMALTQGYAWIVGANGEFYRAAGKPKVETTIMFITLPIYLIAYLYAVNKGLEFFVWIRLAMTIIGVLVQLVVANILSFICMTEIGIRVMRTTICCALPLIIFRPVFSNIDWIIANDIYIAIFYILSVAIATTFFEREPLRQISSLLFGKPLSVIQK